jgi:hypothetical protein
MTNRAHRQRRQRTTRKTHGPQTARVLRRRQRALKRVRVLAEFTIIGEGFTAMAFRSMNAADAIALVAENAQEVSQRLRDIGASLAQTVMAMYAQGLADGRLLAEGLSIEADGEFWPDAQTVRFGDDKEASRRERLQDWLERSGDVLDEATQDPSHVVQLHTEEPAGDWWRHVAGSSWFNPLDDDEPVGLWPAENPAIARTAREAGDNPVEGLPDRRAETDPRPIDPETVDGE